MTKLEKARLHLRRRQSTTYALAGGFPVTQRKSVTDGPSIPHLNSIYDVAAQDSKVGPGIKVQGRVESRAELIGDMYVG